MERAKQPQVPGIFASCYSFTQVAFQRTDNTSKAWFHHPTPPLISTPAPLTKAPIAMLIVIGLDGPLDQRALRAQEARSLAPAGCTRLPLFTDQEETTKTLIQYSALLGTVTQ